MATLTAERLRELLEYEPETGVFRWLVSNSNRCKVGNVAGHISKAHGYTIIGVDGRVYRAGRLAWLYMTGDWPPKFIDHVNRDRTDDRWENLRLADRSQNQANRGVQSNNIVGVKGVSLHRPTGKFHVRVGFRKKQHYIGLYGTLQEASRAYQAAAERVQGEYALSQGG